MNHIRKALKEKMPTLVVREDAEHLNTYFEHSPCSLKLVEALPEGEEQVAEILFSATNEGWKVFTSNGYSLGEGAAKILGVVLNFERMDKIIKLDPKNLVARVQRGVTYPRLLESLKGTGVRPAFPAYTITKTVLTSALNRDVTMNSNGFPESKVQAMKVVLADGRIHLTGSQALSENSISWTGDGGPYLSQWYLGSRDIFGVVILGHILLYVRQDGRYVLAFSFEDLRDCLAVLKDISRRQYIVEGMVVNNEALAILDQGVYKKAPNNVWTLIAGIEAFPELAMHYSQKVKESASKSGGKLLENGVVDIGLLERPHRWPPNRSLCFYSTFKRCLHLQGVAIDVLKEECQGREPAIMFVSISGGRTLFFTYAWENDASSVKTNLFRYLHDEGAFFDVPPYLFLKKILIKDETYWNHLNAIKDMVDPHLTINPHEFKQSTNST